MAVSLLPSVSALAQVYAIGIVNVHQSTFFGCFQVQVAGAI